MSGQIPELSDEQIRQIEKELRESPPESYEEQQERARQRRLHPTDDFCCPICHGTAYEAHTESDGLMGPAGSSWVTHFVCGGCSAHFGDPIKFTAAGRKSPA